MPHGRQEGRKQEDVTPGTTQDEETEPLGPLSEVEGAGGLLQSAARQA